MKEFSIKVLHVARRFISDDLSELKIGYDLIHFQSMSEFMIENAVIFQSKEKHHKFIKIKNLSVFLVPSLVSLFFSIIKNGKNFDLIVAQNPFVAGLLCVIAGKIINKPVLISIHGYEFTVGKIQSLMKKFVCLKATKIRANSNIVKETIIKWGIKPEKIKIVEDRVDCSHFNLNVNGDKIRKELEIKNYMIISIGSLIEIKGFDTLLEAVKLVKKSLDDIKFVIVGDGIQKEKLIEQIKKLGIEKNVILCGNIPYKDLPKYFAACDLFVHPSYVESMGRVILEAQASGKPVIATNIGGIPEAVSEQSAILIHPKKPKILAETILKLLGNKEMMANMAKNGRELMLKKFEFWKQEQKLIEFYDKIILESKLK